VKSTLNTNHDSKQDVTKSNHKKKRRKARKGKRKRPRADTDTSSDGVAQRKSKRTSTHIRSDLAAIRRAIESDDSDDDVTMKTGPMKMERQLRHDPDLYKRFQRMRGRNTRPEPSSSVSDAAPPPALPASLSPLPSPTFGVPPLSPFAHRQHTIALPSPSLSPKPLENNKDVALLLGLKSNVLNKPIRPKRTPMKIKIPSWHPHSGPNGASPQLSPRMHKALSTRRQDMKLEHDMNSTSATGTNQFYTPSRPITNTTATTPLSNASTPRAPPNTPVHDIPQPGWQSWSEQDLADARRDILKTENSPQMPKPPSHHTPVTTQNPMHVHTPQSYKPPQILWNNMLSQSLQYPQVQVGGMLTAIVSVKEKGGTVSKLVRVPNTGNLPTSLQNQSGVLTTQQYEMLQQLGMVVNTDEENQTSMGGQPQAIQSTTQYGTFGNNIMGIPMAYQQYTHQTQQPKQASHPQQVTTPRQQQQNVQNPSPTQPIRYQSTVAAGRAGTPVMLNINGKLVPFHPSMIVQSQMQYAQQPRSPQQHRVPIHIAQAARAMSLHSPPSSGARGSHPVGVLGSRPKQAQLLGTKAAVHQSKAVANDPMPEPRSPKTKTRSRSRKKTKVVPTQRSRFRKVACRSCRRELSLSQFRQHIRAKHPNKAEQEIENLYDEVDYQSVKRIN